MRRLPARMVEGLTTADLGDFVGAPSTGDVLVWDGTAWTPGPATPATRIVPLTTTVGGTPQLVWDADDNLVMVEVSS